MFEMSFSGVSIDTILSIIVFIVGIVSYLLYKNVRKKHLNDPEFQKRKAQREEQQREKMRLEKENDELNALMMSRNDDYSDD